MNTVAKNWALCLGVSMLLACNEKNAPAQAEGVPEAQKKEMANKPSPFQAFTQSFPTNAQPKLQTVKLWLGTSELETEVAHTVPQIQAGMMWRTNMAEMEGMLFVFPSPRQVSFWMKNTLLPLSCAYIDAEGAILEIYDMQPRDESPIPSSSRNIQYVLEVNQGWFNRHNVNTGAVVRTEFGTLQQTFFRRR